MMRLLLALCLVAPWCRAQSEYTSWTKAGGDGGNLHYSSLRQINKQNVSGLKVAWKFDSGDSYRNSDVQCNPIVVNGVMYITTATLRVVALDAKTGRELWTYRGHNEQRAPHANRGVTFWSDGKSSRILLALGHDLLSLDAATGRPDDQFGKAGRVDLEKAYGERASGDFALSVTSPGVIYRDLIILGSTLSESLPALPGDIRAYNIRTGALAWSFHTIPHPGEFGYETWPPEAWKTSGAANAWAGLVVDEERGSVFVPTGSPAFDFYGSDRHGKDLFSDSLICLDAATGKRKWHFQAVHHDVWDLDFPAPPVLVSSVRNGRTVPAVAVAGKTGFVYVLDRETGQSLFPLEERPVPASAIDGEQLSPTQPVPLKPLPFARQRFTDDMITNRSPEAHKFVADRLQQLDHGDLFVPPSRRGTVFFPGLAGGAEWGGEAYDPETHVFYVNGNELPWVVRLVPPGELKRMTKASRLYQARCAACHGSERKGAPPEYPALQGVGTRLTSDQIQALLHHGNGRMPAFASLGDPAINALVTFLEDKGDPDVEVQQRSNSGSMLKYTSDGYHKFLDQDGYPANSPPWGTLSAINLDTGDYCWKIPLGEYPELVARGMPNTGSENHGGGVVTAGGLFFIGATHYDNKFRAFDKTTGKLLWETVLPHAANATPSTYEVDGKQYVVVAAGGGRERESGSTFFAFALP